MLRTVIAAAFKSKGRKSMSKPELTYVLSFDLKWFSHDKSRQIVELAIEKGLLSEEEGGGDGGGNLAPAFDVDSVEVPIDFKPDLKKILSTSVFDEIVQEIADRSGKDVGEVVAMINRRQEELGNLLDVEVVALLIAKRYGVDVSRYVDRVWEEVVGAG